MDNKHITRREVAGMFVGIIFGYLVGGVLAYSGGAVFGSFDFGVGVLMGSLVLGFFGALAGAHWYD